MQQVGVGGQRWLSGSTPVGRIITTRAKAATGRRRDHVRRPAGDRTKPRVRRIRQVRRRTN